MAQPLLETGQSGLLVPGFDKDHPVRRKPSRFQTRREQILIAHTPEDLPLGARHDARCKRGGSSTIQRAIAGTGDLVQRSQRQSPTGQPCVHFRQPERQNPSRGAVRRLKAPDFFAQKINGGRRSHFTWYP